MSILNSVMNVFKLTGEDDYDEYDDYDEEFEDDEDALSRHQGGIQQRNRRQRKRRSGKINSAIR